MHQRKSCLLHVVTVLHQNHLFFQHIHQKKTIISFGTILTKIIIKLMKKLGQKGMFFCLKIYYFVA